MDRRLDLNDLLVGDPYATFFFRWAGPDTGPVRSGDTLVVDRSAQPAEGDLVLVSEDGRITMVPYRDGTPVWGRVAWSLTRLSEQNQEPA